MDWSKCPAVDRDLTCDQNYAYQQTLQGPKIAVVILSSNRWPLIEPVANRIAAPWISRVKAKSPASN